VSTSAAGYKSTSPSPDNHASDEEALLARQRQQRLSLLLRHTTTAGVREDEGSIRKLAAIDEPNVLNVHVVPHTHDDVGWRKTVEQYYYGLNNTIDNRGNVRSIISTVVQALLDNPSRTFVFVEMKFFSMWWYEQNDAVRDSVRHLVSTRQIVFANGGWCMHDEASTHYIGMIDQTTLGHDFLKNELGYVPKVAWQLDPFGHSSTQASLLTSKMGMDAIYFGRIDYQDLQLRRLSRECEGLWRPANSSSADTGGEVFWGLTGGYHGNYGPPDGFWFDVLTPENKQLVGMNETRLLQRLRTFLQDIRIQSDQTKGNHIQLTMGSDFHVCFCFVVVGLYVVDSLTSDCSWRTSYRSMLVFSAFSHLLLVSRPLYGHFLRSPPKFKEAHYNFANYDLLIGAVMNYQTWNMVDIASLFGPKYDRVNIFYSHPGTTQYWSVIMHHCTVTFSQW